MGMRAPVTLNGHVSKDIDWADTKRRIVAALGPEGVRREFIALGVAFEGQPNAKGKATCHAMDRPDEHASAFCNLATGIYHSKGEKVETLNLFDFALRYGKFGDWLVTIKHFARLTGVSLDGAHKDSNGRILEVAYDYKSEDGELLYQVVRYRLPNGDKTFRPRRPDGKDGWITGTGVLDGVRHVLYRLGEIIDQPESIVVVVEGEKDADRLNGLQYGMIATTNAHGSGDTARWKSYAETLRGRAVVIIPDSDKPGQRHARGVADHLHGVAASVKVIDLPGVGPKGDVSDWLDQGNEPSDLFRLIVEAPPWDPAAPLNETPTESPAKLTIGLDEIVEEDVDWIYENVIAIGFISIFAGQTGQGKSFVVCDLIARLTRGDLFPFSTDRRPPSRILMISEDPLEQMLGPRLNSMGAIKKSVRFMTWEAMARYTLDDTDMLDLAYLECDSPILLVIDPPQNFLGRADEHKNAEVRTVLMRVVAWLQKRLAACILIMHVNKQIGKGLAALDRIMGSVAWATTPRIAIGFTDNPDVQDEHIMAGIKNNLGPKAQAVAYRIERIPDNPKRAKIEWVGTLDITADDAMNKVKKKPVGICAVEWITDRFREQPEWESNELRRLAKDAGVSLDAIFKGPEVAALPIIKRPRIDASGNHCWTWRAKDGWPEKSSESSESSES